MIKSKFLTAAFVVLCCLFACSESKAQSAYGYATIVYDEGTNMVSGYGSTDLDYTTAYYYDAQVDAQITDGNGNVLASGSSIGNPAAILNLDVIDVLLCIPYDIIINIIIRPRIYYDYDYGFGCRSGYDDYFGFDDFWWGSFWDYGGFTSNRGRSCSYRNIFYIAQIVARVIRCLPASTTCDYDRLEILPSEFRPKHELPFESGPDKMNVTCTTTDHGGLNRVAEQTVNLRLGPEVIDSGGHELHTGTRPLGKLDRTTGRSDFNGETKFVFTAPIFGGSTRVTASIPGGNIERFVDVIIKVPGLQELPAGDNYHRIGITDEHPYNHYGKPETLTGLKEIADDYKAIYYPNGFPPNPPGMVAKDRLGPNDWYKIHYNDISVKNGGKFEVHGKWDRNDEHDEHRVGRNCDTRSKNIPGTHWTRLKQIFRERGSPQYHDHTRERAPHWHLRFLGNVQISQDLTTSPFGESPAQIPGTIEAEQFDQGSNTAAYYIPFTGELDPEEKPVDVDISDAQNGIRYISSTSGGQWMNYTVNISSSRSYSFDTRVASPVGGGTFHFEVDGVDKTGPISIPYTGSDSTFQSVVVDDIYLDAGQHSVRLVVEGTGQNVASFDSFTVNPYIAPEVCDPPYWEIQNCQSSGGYWDDYFCQCNYGMY